MPKTNLVKVEERTGRTARYDRVPKTPKATWRKSLELVMNEPVSPTEPNVKKIRAACDSLMTIAMDPAHSQCVNAIRLAMDLMGERPKNDTTVNVGVSVHLADMLARVETRAAEPIDVTPPDDQ